MHTQLRQLQHLYAISFDEITPICDVFIDRIIVMQHITLLEDIMSGNRPENCTILLYALIAD